MRIMPVSVCHQVSTMGAFPPPTCSWYQSQASGLIGSPTEPSRRRLERSGGCGQASPRFLQGPGGGGGWAVPPADVGGAPEDVVRLDVEDRLVGEARADQVARRGMYDALRLGRGARRVEQVEHVLRLDRRGRAERRLALHDLVPPVVATLEHVDRIAQPAHDEEALP